MRRKGCVGFGLGRRDVGIAVWIVLIQGRKIREGGKVRREVRHL